eukprot:5353092-Amphidinium_carterae.1
MWDAVAGAALGIRKRHKATLVAVDACLIWFMPASLPSKLESRIEPSVHHESSNLIGSKTTVVRNKVSEQC